MNRLESFTGRHAGKLIIFMLLGLVIFFICMSPLVRGHPPQDRWQIEGTVTDYEVSMGGFGHPSAGTLFFDDGSIQHVNPEEQDSSVIFLNKYGVWYFERWKWLGTQVYRVDYNDLGTLWSKDYR